MKKSYIYGLWAVLYCLCAGLGFIPGPAGLGKALLIACSFLFFLPPYYLAWQSCKQNDRKTLRLLRYISLSAIGLFLVLFALTVLVVASTGKTYPILEVLLQFGTVPMGCGQNILITLFLWACLLMISLRKPAEK